MNVLFLRIIFFPFLLLFSIPTIAFAHFPSTDHTITVILHVDPNDDPVPGEKSRLYFDFGDTTNRFKLTNCTCIVSVLEKTNQIFHHRILEQKSTTPSIWGSSVQFVFPQRDVYTIILTGKPLQPNQFQQFHLTWYFRVDQFPKVNNPTITLIPLASIQDISTQKIISVLIILLVLISISYFLIFRYRQKISKKPIDIKKQKKYTRQ